MAKRYHQSKSARRAEHMGMERYERGAVHSNAYSDPVPNHIGHGRPQYKHDMIQEDRRAPALLPQHVIEKYYPNDYGYLNAENADLYSGVQKQLMEDARDRNKVFKPSKY